MLEPELRDKIPHYKQQRLVSLRSAITSFVVGVIALVICSNAVDMLMGGFSYLVFGISALVFVAGIAQVISYTLWLRELRISDKKDDLLFLEADTK